MEFLEIIKVINIALSLYVLEVLFRFCKCTKTKIFYFFIVIFFIILNIEYFDRELNKTLWFFYDTIIIILILSLIKNRKWKQH